MGDITTIRVQPFRIERHSWGTRTFLRSGAPQRERRRNIRLSILLAISNIIISSLDLAKVLKNTIDKALEVLDPDSVRIYPLDSAEKGLRLDEKYAPTRMVAAVVHLIR